MDSSWDCTNASRDACATWDAAEPDVARFQEMLDADGTDLRFYQDGFYILTVEVEVDLRCQDGICILLAEVTLT